MIQKISHGQDEIKHSIMALLESDINLYTTRQGHLQSNTEFMRAFKSQMETNKINDSAPWIHMKLYDLYLGEAVRARASITDMKNTTMEI